MKFLKILVRCFTSPVAVSIDSRIPRKAAVYFKRLRKWTPGMRNFDAAGSPSVNTVRIKRTKTQRASVRFAIYALAPLSRPFGWLLGLKNAKHWHAFS